MAFKHFVISFVAFSLYMFALLQRCKDLFTLTMRTRPWQCYSVWYISVYYKHVAVKSISDLMRLLKLYSYNHNCHPWCEQPYTLTKCTFNRYMHSHFTIFLLGRMTHPALHRFLSNQLLSHLALHRFLSNQLLSRMRMPLPQIQPATD